MWHRSWMAPILGETGNSTWARLCSRTGGRGDWYEAASLRDHVAHFTGGLRGREPGHPASLCSLGLAVGVAWHRAAVAPPFPAACRGLRAATCCFPSATASRDTHGLNCGDLLGKSIPSASRNQYKLAPHAELSDTQHEVN